MEVVSTEPEYDVVKVANLKRGKPIRMVDLPPGCEGGKVDV